MNVKKLQELAWGLQTRANKPGGRLPDEYRHEVHRVASRALAICTDAEYIEEADFLEQAAIAEQEIEAKKAELAEVEAAQEKEFSAKCYRPTSGGSYAVSKKSDSTQVDNTFYTVASSSTMTCKPQMKTVSSNNLAAELAKSTEVLQLSGTGLGDADIEGLCEKLHASGLKLKKLDLSCNNITDTGVQCLVAALASKACPELLELRLHGNAFSTLGTNMLTSGLAVLRPRLAMQIHPDPGSTSSGTGSCVEYETVIGEKVTVVASETKCGPARSSPCINGCTDVESSATSGGNVRASTVDVDAFGEGATDHHDGGSHAYSSYGGLDS